MIGPFTVPPGEGPSTPRSVPGTVSVALAVDTLDLRVRLAAAINGAPALTLVERSAPHHAKRASADVLVVEASDVPMIDTVRQGRMREPDARILLICSDPRRAPILQLLQVGMRGILSADAAADAIARAVPCVMAGQYWMGRSIVGEIVRALARPPHAAASSPDPPAAYALTPAEAAILELITAGCSNKDIAEQRKISSATVKSHLTSIFQKTGTSNRLQLARLVMKQHPDDAS